MITLKEFIEAIEYKITEGSDYQWDCFGPNARYLDCAGPNLNQDYNISAIFDSKDQTVYAIEVWDYRADREYRWINNAYVKDHMKSCAKYNVDIYESMDGRNYIDLDVAEDILEKANALVNGKAYDERVQIPLNVDEDTLYMLMKEAHNRDLTLNEFVEDLLSKEIARRKNED